MNKFYVGQKVVCIKKSEYKGFPSTIGEVLTIIKVEALCIGFKEYPYCNLSSKSRFKDAKEYYDEKFYSKMEELING